MLKEVERLLVVLELIVALGSAVVVNRLFVRGKLVELRHYAVKYCNRLLVVSVVEVAHSDVSPKAVVQSVVLAESVEQEQCLVVFAALEIVDSSRELFSAVELRLGCNAESEECESNGCCPEN